MLKYKRHMKNKEKEKEIREQRYAWHVVSCVAEKNNKKKKSTIGSVPLLCIPCR